MAVVLGAGECAGAMDAEAILEEMHAVSGAWEQRLAGGGGAHRSVFSAGERAFFRALKHHLEQCAAAATERERMHLIVATARWYSSRLSRSASLRRSFVGDDAGAAPRAGAGADAPPASGRRVVGSAHLGHCFAAAPSVSDAEERPAAAAAAAAPAGQRARGRSQSLEKRRSQQRAAGPGPVPALADEGRRASAPMEVVWRQQEDRMDLLRKKAAAVGARSKST